MQSFIPSNEEIKEVKDFIDKLKSQLKKFYCKNRLVVEIYDVGSTAKGTFVRGDFDVDLYVMTDDPYRAYQLAQHFFPEGKRKYGELLIWHFIVDRFDVDLVFARPGYVKEDTLKHPAFYRKALTPRMKYEVIKAKAYFKTKGVYGAEIGGITGVCVEELVRQHGSFDKLCSFLLENVRKPFIQDPVLTRPRDLLASVTPRRWKQIRNACKEYLTTKKVEYKPFSEADFRKRYYNYAILEFIRRRDRSVDFFTAQSIALHSARMLKNLENEAEFEFDVFVTENKVLVALKGTPLTLSPTKKVCLHKKFRQAIENFKRAHPSFFQEGNYLCAMVKRKYTKPLEAYINLFREQMLERGYEEIWAKFMSPS
jgi:tRNA nucleotidyltransferase (CCA-adding enzyme)